MLASKISAAVTLHPSQRGFRPLDGTLANSLILEHYIRSRRSTRKPYNVIALDVRKAFDTCSHNSLERALFRVGIPAQITSYILNTFNSATVIKLGPHSTRPLKFNRGVKQGDPLSPLLFNILIDELLTKLHTLPVGGTIGPNIRCPAMAFADDLVLLEDDEAQFPINLGLVNDFFVLEASSKTRLSRTHYLWPFPKGVLLLGPDPSFA